jgi:hypothetical protein
MHVFSSTPYCMESQAVMERVLIEATTRILIMVKYAYHLLGKLHHVSSYHLVVEM